MQSKRTNHTYPMSSGTTRTAATLNSSPNYPGKIDISKATAEQEPPSTQTAGWSTVASRRGPKLPTIRFAAMAHPTPSGTAVAEKVRFGDGQRFLKTIPEEARRTKWQPYAEATHERKHGRDSIGIAKRLCASLVDEEHPAFTDPKNGDIYRFDVVARHMAITTAHGDIKSCYPKTEVQFRKAALICQQNTSSMTYERLGFYSSGQTTTNRKQWPSTLREDIFDRAVKSGFTL